ncbi:acyl-CoA dehydrogenase family protein [Variovorax boronicumulans]|uniref:acyl-CoA dehydrogenase family protein n=1 Tax=Variovorax boronicumulans TaxID=436515 RepID=UPI001C597520
MDLDFTAVEEAFRAEVRAFLATQLPAALRTRVAEGRTLTKAEMVQWHAILQSRGWLASHWPREHGGPGWTAVERFVFEYECALADAPRTLPFGLIMLGPVLIRYGTPAQKAHWLPRILDGSDWWCQGYSEPGAGSDLAALRTRAVRTTDVRGEHYLVNGQKTWTTLAQHADMIFCLVRTSMEARPQRGISFLLIDMKSPGVEVRPIVTLDGEHEVNEVFFTDVRVPLENLVGEENEGWTCAKYLLTHERNAGIGFCVAALQRLKTVAARVQRQGRPLDQDPLFAARMARVEIALENLKTTSLRVTATVAAGGSPGVQSSALKVLGSEIRQELSSLIRRAVGPRAQAQLADALALDGSPPEAATAAAQYLNNRKLSIFGGSNEVQRGIIAKTMLGL